MNNREKRHQAKVFLAAQMLQAGRPVDFTKEITGLTLNEMAGRGMIYQKDGRVFSTPGVKAQQKTDANSSKKLKQKDRATFFSTLRAEKKARMRALMEVNNAG